MLHTAIEPTIENGGASWWCTEDNTPCASDNPCDCCELAAIQLDETTE